MPDETEHAFATRTQATAIAALLSLLHACAMQENNPPPPRIQHRILKLLNGLSRSPEASEPLRLTLEELAEGWQARLDMHHAGART